MRNLLNVIESVMSSDLQVTSQAEQDAVAVKIVQYFCKIFKDMYMSKDSHYDKNSDYVAGCIPVTNYDKDRYIAETEIRKDIRSFFKMIKSEFSNVKCEIKTKSDSYGYGYSILHYRLLITLNSGTNKAEIYGITITVDEKPYNTKFAYNDSDLNYIRVLVSNDNLKRIFHQLVK